MAIISEHEQKTEDFSLHSEDQSKEQESVIKMINEMLQRGKRFRERFDRTWHDNYEFVVNGKQWAMHRPRWRFNEVVNQTWAAIMTEIAIQTDAQPKFEFLGQEITDDAFSDALGKVHDGNWEKYNWNDVVSNCLMDCKLYHVAHAEVGWDEDLAQGLGDVTFSPLDPFYLYWDPAAHSLHGPGKRARWIIYAEPIATSIIKGNYPKEAEKIKPDTITLDQNRGPGAISSVKVINTFDTFQPSRASTSAAESGETFGGEPTTVLIRAWLRDDTLEQVESEKTESDQESSVKEFIIKKKFPKGRYIEIANNRILRDGAPGTFIKGQWVEYESDMFPVARLVNYSYSREYAGENEVTHTRGPQKIINYIWSYILDCFRIQANPKQIITHDSGIDPAQLTNEPGNIIVSNTQGGYRQEVGQAISPGSFELLGTANDLFNQVQGLQDVSRGAVQTGIDSGVLFEGFLEAAQTRPRMKNRNLDLFLQECGQLMFDRYLQFYNHPRIQRITNKEGYPEFIQFVIPNVRNDKGNKSALIRRFKTVTDDINGLPVIENGVAKTQDISNQTLEIKGKPDIRVTSGSALPFAKAQKAQRALTFFNSQAIDREELLNVVDWPNKEQVLQRLQEAEQAQADAAAQQGK